MHRSRIALIVLGLLVSACTGSSGENTTTAGEGPTTTAALATTTAAPATTTTPAPEDTTTAAGATGSESDCLVGTWVLDSEAFVENFSSVFAEAGMPDAEVTALGGTFTVELADDGSLNAVREEWGFSIVTGEGTVTIEINGTETGTWSADDSTLTVSTEVTDLSVDASVEVDGQVVPLPDAPVQTPPGISTGSEYRCAGDVLTLTNAGVESVLNRS